jgi:rhodanese-related sulfurtransferase
MILRIGEPLVGRLLLIDAATMTFRSINVRKDPECPACGTHEIRELKGYDELCSTGAEAVSSVAGQVVEISPSQLSARLENSRDVDLIEVREPSEWRLGHIPGARLVPLGQIPDEIPRLDPARETIVYCKVGGRSRHAARQLVDAGIKNVSNLAGGILAWRDEIDPSLLKY